MLRSENGAMAVIPKSHRHGQIAFERSAAEEKNVLGQTVHGATQYGDVPHPFEMKAGQMSLHSDLLLHGSEPEHIRSAALRVNDAVRAAGGPAPQTIGTNARLSPEAAIRMDIGFTTPVQLKINYRCLEDVRPRKLDSTYVSTTTYLCCIRNR